MIEENKLRSLLKDPGLDVDFFLVDLQVLTDNKVRIYVDNMKGITIDECVRISRFLEARLDEAGYVFELEVSSPGLDMPFKVPEQFEKSIGKTVQVNMDDGKKKTGRLLSFNGDTIEMEVVVREKIKGKKKKQERFATEKIGLNNIMNIKRIISF